jgi:hypothetical protein
MASSAAVRIWSISARFGGRGGQPRSDHAQRFGAPLGMGNGFGHGEGLVEQAEVQGSGGGQSSGDRGQASAAVPVILDVSCQAEGLVDQRGVLGRVNGGQPRGV